MSKGFVFVQENEPNFGMHRVRTKKKLRKCLLLNSISLFIVIKMRYYCPYPLILTRLRIETSLSDDRWICSVSGKMFNDVVASITDSSKPKNIITNFSPRYSSEIFCDQLSFQCQIFHFRGTPRKLKPHVRTSRPSVPMTVSMIKLSLVKPEIVHHSLI